MSLSNSIKTCKSFAKIKRFSILPSLLGFGIALNIIVLILFFNKRLRFNKVFCYLGFKAIFDIGTLIVRILYVIIKCKTCSFSSTYSIFLWANIINDYIKQWFPKLSIFCEILAAFYHYSN